MKLPGKPFYCDPSIPLYPIVGSQLAFDLPSDDDESEPDPELAALLHQKIVTVRAVTAFLSEKALV